MTAYHWGMKVIGFLISVPSDLRDSIPLGHDGDWFSDFCPSDLRDSVPLGHDGDWFSDF